VSYVIHYGKVGEGRRGREDRGWYETKRDSKEGESEGRGWDKQFGNNRVGVKGGRERREVMLSSLSVRETVGVGVGSEGAKGSHHVSLELVRGG
jgi:hypothetical protein